MDQLHELFRSFINDIIKVFPEYEERLHDTYEDLFLEEKDKLPENYLQDFLKQIKKHNEKLSCKDDSLFTSDPIMIPNISFKMMWNSKISKKTKQTIWKYLITFGTMEIQLRCGDKINDVLKSIDEHEKVKDKETVGDMKKLKKMNELLSNEDLWKEEVIEDIPSLPEGMEGMEQLLGNTNIGKIAQEITDELDIGKMMSGGGGIEDLLSGGNIMKIFQSINSKIESKVSSEDFKKEDLLGEANDICGTMKDNPLFSSLMGSMQNMGGGIPNQQQTQQTHPDVKNINLNQNKPVASNKTQKRLQKKLQDKKDGVSVEKLNK